VSSLITFIHGFPWSLDQHLAPVGIQPPHGDPDIHFLS